MSLDRKDIRAKLDPDLHHALQVLARVQGITDAELVEQILVPVIRRRVHEASVIAAEAQLAGMTGIGRELSGLAGNSREQPGVAPQQGRGGRR